MKKTISATNPIFNPDFDNLDTNQVINEIRDKGYFAFEDALDESFTNQLLKNIDFDEVLLNKNDTGVVTAQNIKYLTHCLANSQEVYSVITSEKVLEICKQYFKDKYKLTNHRVYETSKDNYMPWHTDNNRQIGTKFSGKHSMSGLLFLFYLSDVTINAFQFVQNSHKHSHKHDNEIYLSNAFVDETYGKEIVTFRMKKGSFILCDTHGIHRAEPYSDKKYKRTTLLFQVDEVGNDNEGHGEKNLINTEYLKNLDTEVMDYLGFGYNRNYPAFPNTSIATLPLSDILKVQKQLFSKTISSFTKTLVKAVLPGEALVKAKRVRWQIKAKK